jgi:DedD protein
MATTATKDKTLDPTSDVKRRARRRLVGAGVVSGLAALALTMVLDREPRPVTPDVVLKGAGNTPPLSAPLPAAPTAPLSPPPSAAPEPAVAPVAPAPEASGAPAAAEEPRRPALVLNPQPKEPVSKPAADPIEKLAKEKSKDAAAKSKDQEKATVAAKPLPVQAAPAGAKSAYALQVGAFANKESASNALAKLKTAGLSGYIETISTPQGDRMRVRAGPYKDRDAAQAAHSKLKSAGIDAALIAPQ